MEENDEYEICNHKDQRPDCGTNGKETDETKNPKVSPGRCLLQRSGIDESFRVDVRVEDEEQVVAISQVDEIKPDCSET